MNTFLLIAIVVLIFVVIFQISKASEYVSILKGEEKARKQDNKINAFLMIVFLVLGLIGVWWCNDLLYHKTLFSYGAASSQGRSIDKMMWITIVITGIVFFATQILLFWFSFKYQESDKRKAYIIPTAISWNSLDRRACHRAYYSGCLWIKILVSIYRRCTEGCASN